MPSGLEHSGFVNLGWCGAGCIRYVSDGNEMDARGRGEKSKWCIGGKPCYCSQSTCWDNTNPHWEYGNARDLEWKVEYKKESGNTKISWVEGEGLPITIWKSDGVRVGSCVWL